jgi:beta-glucosidase
VRAVIVLKLSRATDFLILMEKSRFGFLRFFLGVALLLPALTLRASVADAPRIFLIGGSTMADFPAGHPKSGWGQMLPRFFNDPAMIRNHARSGRSSKSFIEQGLWDKVVGELRAGDYLIMCWGTNDSSADPARKTDPRTTFQANLRRFIAETRAKGATPILATQVAHRRWSDNGEWTETVSEYAQVNRELAASEQVPLLEMYELTTALEKGLGVEGSIKLHAHLEPRTNEFFPEGLKDNTHYSAYGATRVAALAVQEFRRLNLPFCSWLKTAAEAPGAATAAGGEDETRPVAAVDASAHLLFRDPKQPLDARVEDLLARLTLDEKLNLLGGIKDLFIRGVERFDIPEMKTADGPLGVRQWGESTLYPATMLLAATWNPARATQFGTALGRDSRARNVQVLLGPGVNIYRSPMNGRNFEYLGEDPWLASRMVVASIRALQAQGVSATIKHYAANNTEIGRLYLSSEVDERTLREIYLPVFRAAVVEADVWSVMGSYNRINGPFSTEHDWLNNQVLKKEWGFKGVLMSDWGATHDTLAAALGGLDLEMGRAVFFTADKLRPLVESGQIPRALIDDKARRVLRLILVGGWLEGNWWNQPISLNDPASATAALEIAREGITLLKNEGNLLPFDRTKAKSIAVLGPNAVKHTTGLGSGYVKPFRPVSFLDGIRAQAGATQIVSIPENAADPYVNGARYDGKLKLELFPSGGQASAPVYSTETDRIDAAELAGHYEPSLTARSRWIGRWSGRLAPMAPGDYEFVVDSHDAHVKVTVDGRQVWRSNSQAVTSFLVSLPGDRAVSFVVEVEQRKSFLPMRARVGWGPKRPVIPPEQVAALRAADAAVVCVGFNVVTGEGEGDDRPYALPGRQEELIRETARLNPRTIVVLNAGGSVATEGWIERVPGLLHAFYSGQEGGTALAEILFGDINPSGRMPFTWEKRWEDTAAFQSGYPDVTNPAVKTVEYREGIFVGYRWFDAKRIAARFPFGHGLSYTTFTYDKLTAQVIDDEVRVTVDVTNTGARAGAEVVQLYVSQPQCSVRRPVRELKGFAKVVLAPGERRTVELTLSREAFAFFHPERKRWTVEPGEFVLEAGASAADLRQTIRIRIP